MRNRNRSTRASGTLAAALPVLPAASISVAAQERLSVHVFMAPPAAGVMDQATKRRKDATRTIEDDLKKRKETLTVVDSMEAADVVVQIISAGPVVGDQQLGPDLSATDCRRRGEMDQPEPQTRDGEPEGSITLRSPK